MNTNEIKSAMLVLPKLKIGVHSGEACWGCGDYKFTEEEIQRIEKTSEMNFKDVIQKHNKKCVVCFLNCDNTEKTKLIENRQQPYTPKSLTYEKIEEIEKERKEREKWENYYKNGKNFDFLDE